MLVVNRSDATALTFCLYQRTLVNTHRYGLDQTTTNFHFHHSSAPVESTRGWVVTEGLCSVLYQKLHKKRRAIGNDLRSLDTLHNVSYLVLFPRYYHFSTCLWPSEFMELCYNNS